MVSDRPKRCWNCGFLYAIGRSASTARDAVIDPDELRNEAIMDTLNRISHGSPDSTDTQAAAIGILEKPVSGLPYETAHWGLVFPAWKDVISFQCLQQQLEPLMLGIVGLYESVKEFPSPQEGQKYGTKVVRITAKRVLEELYETDRLQCPHFPYRPGFSAKEHAELQLQDIRRGREEAFQQIALNIQSSLQSQSVQQQRRANLLTLGLLIVAAVSLALSIISIVISILIATGRLS